jgi:hypothetical protein
MIFRENGALTSMSLPRAVGTDSLIHAGAYHETGVSEGGQRALIRRTHRA